MMTQPDTHAVSPNSDRKHRVPPTIKLSWLDEDETVILIQMPEHWTVSDYLATYAAVCEMGHDKHHYSLLVVGIQNAPTNILSMIFRVVRSRPKNMLYTVVVGDTYFVRSMVGILERAPVSKNYYRLAERFEDACAFLNVTPKQSVTL